MAAFVSAKCALPTGATGASNSFPTVSFGTPVVLSRFTSNPASGITPNAAHSLTAIRKSSKTTAPVMLP